MAEEKQVRYDIDGFDVLTAAIRELVNNYPGLNGNDEISFATLDESSGKAMYPSTGAVIETERTDITGCTTQVCLYPFYVIYRSSGLSENRKASVKEWLDNLGRWLERQEVIIADQTYRLDQYPPLTGNRKFLSVERQTPGYYSGEEENKAENWVIYISARYQNKFYRRK